MLALSTVARNSRSLGLFRKTGVRAISCSAYRQAHVRVLSARRDSSQLPFRQGTGKFSSVGFDTYS